MQTQSQLLESASKTPQTPKQSKYIDTALIAASRYKPQFDFHVYDRLEARYQHKPIRGGVFFNTPLKLANTHSSCQQCHYAFEIDAYGRGCMHECVYCYAKAQLVPHGYWNNPIPVPINLTEVHRIFYTVFETDKRSKWRSLLTRRIPLRIGSMSDSFMHMDKKYGVTKELLRILNFYRYPYVIVTKSDLVADDEYLALIDRDLASIQMSLCSINEDLTKKIEPGTPSVKRRLAALKKAAEHGFWTTVRINPLFPIYPDGYFTDPQVNRLGAPEFPFFSWDMIPTLAEHKVPAILAGVVRLSRYSINQLSKSTGIDLNQFFKPEVLKLKGDRHYSDAEIKFYYTAVRDLCHTHNIEFTICYIGNGEKDYWQYQNLMDNRGDCCNARGHVKDIQTSAQDITWQERLKHAPCKDVKVESEKPNMQHYKALGMSKPRPLSTSLPKFLKPDVIA